MTEDLDMTGDDYNVALFTFFITYILFEVRSPIGVVKSSLWQAQCFWKSGLLAPPYRPVGCYSNQTSLTIYLRFQATSSSKE
jgi:hypothetical protein